MRKFIKMSLATLLLGSCLNFAVADTETELENAYMMGGFHTYEQLIRNFKVQGINKPKVEFNKYMVALDISSLPTYKLLIYQQIGYMESLTPLVVNDKYLVFNSYDRKADAIYLQEKVLNSFHFKNKAEKVSIIENENPNGWFKSQFVQKELFDILVEEVNKNVKAKVFVVKEDINVDKKLDTLEEQNKKENIPIKEPVVFYEKSKKENIPQVVIKNEKPVKAVPEKTTVQEADVPKAYNFKLKYVTQMYIYKGDRNADKLEDSKFIPHQRYTSALSSNKYKFATSKVSTNGVEYVKLLDANTWVAKDDIEIIN